MVQHFRWYTVTKVHTGHDEATLDRLQGELAPNMVKIKQDYEKVPVKEIKLSLSLLLIISPFILQ